MSLIRTYSGRLVDLRCLTSHDVALEDVAHGLANVCRWSGQCRAFYSIAQHACLAFDLVRALEPQASRVLLRTTLHHDTPEAYLGDMPTPLKRTPWAAPYRALEAQAWAACVARFVLTDPLPSIVKHVDRVLLATEARDLMGGLVLPDLPEPLPIPQDLVGWWYRAAIVPWTPRRAERAFLQRYAQVACLRDVALGRERAA